MSKKKSRCCNKAIKQDPKTHRFSCSACGTGKSSEIRKKIQQQQQQQSNDVLTLFELKLFR
jgi:ribosomal protein L37E